MSDDRSVRVADLLEEASAAVESIDPTAEDVRSALEDAGMFEYASTAASRVEDEPPGAILESVGLGELPDGTEPQSIPEAIARGDEARVADLRVLVTLARLASDEADDEDALDATFSDLVDAVERSDRAADGRSAADEGGAGERDEGDGSVVESVTAAAGDAVEELTDSSEDASLEDRLGAAVRSSVNGLDEEVRSVRERLEGLRDEEGSETDERLETDEEAPEEAAEAGEESDDDDDESILGGRSSPSGKGTMYSTVAPSPTDRADMRHPTRHSTMPDRS